VAKPAEPPFWRVLLGFALAPLVPASAFFCVAALSTPNIYLPSGIIIYTLIFAYGPVIVIGLGAYSTLKRFLRPRLITICGLAGAVAAAPARLAMRLLFRSYDYYQSGQHVWIENGQRTWWGIAEDMKFFGLIFGLGALAGAAFCLLAIYSPHKRPAVMARGEVSEIG